MFNRSFDLFTLYIMYDTQFTAFPKARDQDCCNAVIYLFFILLDRFQVVFQGFFNESDINIYDFQQKRFASSYKPFRQIIAAERNMIRHDHSDRDCCSVRNLIFRNNLDRMPKSMCKVKLNPFAPVKLIKLLDIHPFSAR